MLELRGSSEAERRTIRHGAPMPAKALRDKDRARVVCHTDLLLTFGEKLSIPKQLPSCGSMLQFQSSTEGLKSPWDLGKCMGDGATSSGAQA